MRALRISVIDAFVGSGPASEHTFAAAKTRDAAAIAAIRGTDDPAQANRIRRATQLVKGWEAGGEFAAMGVRSPGKLCFPRSLS